MLMSMQENDVARGEVKPKTIPLVKLRNLLWALGLAGLFFVGGYSLGRQDALPFLSRNTFDVSSGIGNINVIGNSLASSNDEELQMFWEVWKQLDRKYLDQSKLDRQNMMYGAIKGMVSSLDDPYTVFLTPEENKRSQEDLQGSFSGVGIQLGYKDNPETTAQERWLAVIAPLDGTPAQAAGIQAGELILKIDGMATEGMSVPEAVKLIRGEKGTSVVLTLLASLGEEPRDVTVERQEIDVPSVTMDYAESAGKRAAHLKVGRFGDKTTEELNEAARKIVNDARSGQISGVLLDLRGNPGGYFNKAIEMVGLFVQSGVAVQQEDADGNREPFRISGSNPILKDIPLVVLVDQGSASSSEITAGALRELREAKLVGKTSFGKGTVQSAEDYPNGAGIHITINRWLLPSGASIDKVGVKPDYEVDYAAGEDGELDSQLVKALEVL